MPTFEVTIETPEEGTTLTLVVDADHWVAAWREGLRIMGVKTAPPNAVCEVGADESVRIAVPDAPGGWLVRPRSPTDAPAAPVAPTPAPREGARRLARSPAIDGYPRVPASEHPTSRPEPRPDAPQRSEGVAPLTRRPFVEPNPGDVDPLARRLATGDRARLRRVARRMSVPSVAPAQEPTTQRGRRRPESTRQGRPASGPAADKPQSDDLTSAFSAMENDAMLLPQQFRAIAAPPRDGRPITGGPAEQAVENAWQHIPCQLAQTLRYSQGETLEVVAARGERERETLRCHIETEGAFGRLLSPRPVRVKYSEETSWLRYVDGRGAEALKLLVRSAVCVPIVVGGWEWGVLLLINSTRRSGFAEGELRAVSYLAATLGRELTNTR